MATTTEGVTIHVDAEGVSAAWAVRDMCSELLHHIALIITSGAADGVGGRNELDDATRHLGWCASRRDAVLVAS
jgi:hypothetical protein